MSEGSPVLIGHLGLAYGLSGKPAEARKTLAELKTLADREYVSSSAIALVYMGLGDKAEALGWL